MCVVDKFWNAWAVNCVPSSDHRMSDTAVWQNTCCSAEIKQGVVKLYAFLGKQKSQNVNGMC